MHGEGILIFISNLEGSSYLEIWGDIIYFIDSIRIEFVLVEIRGLRRGTNLWRRQL